MVRYTLDLYTYEEGRRHYENNLKKAKTSSPGDPVERSEKASSAIGTASLKKPTASFERE